MAALSNEAVKKYVESDWHKCPFCGSTEIVAGDSDFDGNTVACKVACLACDETWLDVYRLVDVVPTKA